jgi:hypothetical protein
MTKHAFYDVTCKTPGCEARFHAISLGPFVAGQPMLSDGMLGDFVCAKCGQLHSYEDRDFGLAIVDSPPEGQSSK